jgi:hypothetical protein
MKSVGEVMAMGRTFQESFQKARPVWRTGIDGLTCAAPTARRSRDGERGRRILYVADAFEGMQPRRSSRDGDRSWFLAQIERSCTSSRPRGCTLTLVRARARF